MGIRVPGPRDRIVRPDGTPTEQMQAWMREVSTGIAAAADSRALLDALVAQLIEDEVLPEDWPDDE